MADRTIDLVNYWFRLRLRKPVTKDTFRIYCHVSTLRAYSELGAMDQIRVIVKDEGAEMLGAVVYEMDNSGQIIGLATSWGDTISSKPPADSIDVEKSLIVLPNKPDREPFKHNTDPWWKGVLIPLRPRTSFKSF